MSARRRRREGTRERERERRGERGSFVFNLNVEKNARRGRQERTAGQWRIQGFSAEPGCNIWSLLAATQTHRLLKLHLRWTGGDGSDGNKAMAPAWRYGSGLKHTHMGHSKCMHALTTATHTHTLVAQRTRALMYARGK